MRISTALWAALIALAGCNGTSRDGTEAAPGHDDAGPAAEDATTTGACSPFTESFELTPDTTSRVFFAGGQPEWLDSFGCPWWLAVSPVGQDPLNLAKGGCFTECISGGDQAPTKQSFTWDGAYYPSEATDAGLPTCTTPVCAPAGHYVAHLCVALSLVGQDGGPAAPPTCKEVPFDWPPTAASASIRESIEPTRSGGS